MEWPQIRAHLDVAIEAAKKRGRTQKSIAEVGGLSGQSTVSRQLTYEDTSDGPHLMTFVRLVKGLNIALSDFFTGIEQSPSPTAPPTVPPMRQSDEDPEFERLVGRAFLKALRTAQGEKPSRPTVGRPRRTPRR